MKLASIHTIHLKKHPPPPNQPDHPKGRRTSSPPSYSKKLVSSYPERLTAIVYVQQSNTLSDFAHLVCSYIEHISALNQQNEDFPLLDTWLKEFSIASELGGSNHHNKKKSPKKCRNTCVVRFLHIPLV